MWKQGRLIIQRSWSKIVKIETRRKKIIMLRYYKSSSAAVRIDYWYKYIPILGVSTSNISHYQLQYRVINSINIYLYKAFRLLI